MLVVEDGAALGLLEAQQQADERGLSATGRTHQGHIVPGIDVQVQAVKDIGHIRAVTELEAADADIAAHALEQDRTVFQLRFGLQDGGAQFELRSQQGHVLGNALELFHGADGDGEYAAVGDVV